MAATDATLVLGVLNGDREAFGELYDRRARLIRAICYDACRDLHTAADLSQEVFMRAYHRLGTLDDPQRFGPWLVGIARRVCQEWRRGKLRDRHQLVELPDTAAARPEDGGTSDEVDVLRQAIADLPDKERLALHAFYLQEQSPEQACALLNVSTSGLYHVLGRARKKLRRLLRSREVIS